MVLKQSRKKRKTSEDGIGDDGTRDVRAGEERV